MITQERLKELLNYDAETGTWTWRVRRAAHVLAGSIAGRLDSHGYRQITIDGVAYLASRLAFLWVDGVWPEHHVDHKDVNPANGAWSNLRPATRSQNGGNRRAYKSNKLGVKGVCKVHSGNYEASIQVRGKSRFLGTFYDIESAAAAYAKAAAESFGEYYRAG